MELACCGVGAGVGLRRVVPGRRRRRAQVLQGHIRVSMFGVGGIVEGIVKDSLKNTYK